MNHQYYGAAHAPLSRRATVPIPASLAPTASMIDPALENHTFQYPTQHITHNNGNHLHNSPQPNMVSGFHRPMQQQQTQLQQQAPQKLPKSSTERSLPPKDVNEESIDSAYLQFILFCNPSIPLDVDTDELKKGFHNPPRSDGNSFSPWTLFKLLQRLERKEIKTWAHLVIELGVEPPDLEKNQSTQKVQQYAVRLKVCPSYLVVWQPENIDSVFRNCLQYHFSDGCTHIMLTHSSTTFLPNPVHITPSVRSLMPSWPRLSAKVYNRKTILLSGLFFPNCAQSAVDGKLTRWPKANQRLTLLASDRMSEPVALSSPICSMISTPLLQQAPSHGAPLSMALKGIYGQQPR